MAIVQISKIIHRTGANIDLPQLDTGEIGFSTDEQKLFIGNDPILYPVPNGESTTQLEILTEVSNLEFSKVVGSANTVLEITTPRIGQLLVADGSSTTLIANSWVNWTGNLLGNGTSHSNNKLHLGNVANLEITGGMDGGVLSTDGAGNLYWTTVSGGGGSGDGLPAQTNNSGKYLKTNGTVANWIDIFVDTNFGPTVRSNISVTDAGGDGALSYNSTSGVITYTGPSASEARAHFSAGTGISYDNANGRFSIPQDIATDSDVAFNTVTVNNLTNNGLYQEDDNGMALKGVLFNGTANTLQTNVGFNYNSSYNALSVGSIITEGIIESNAAFKLTHLKTKTPTDPGTPGEICWDTNYLYICTYTDNWEKIEIGSTVAGGGTTYGDSNVSTYLTTNGYVTGTPWTNEGYLTSTDLSGYALSSSIPDVSGFVTGTPWTNEGYLTSTDLSGYALSSSIPDVSGFVTGTPWTNEGYITISALADYATQSYVGNAVANLVNSAPAALDTLKELATALGNDASYSTTITNQLANKLSTSSFSSTANTWISTQSTSNVTEGTNQYYTVARANSAIDARVTKSFVTNLGANADHANVSDVANVALSVNGSNVSGSVERAYNADTASNALSVNGSNVTGQVGNALVAGTVYSSAQPNITSVGTLANLTLANASIDDYGHLIGRSIEVWSGGNIGGTLHTSTVTVSANISIATGLTVGNSASSSQIDLLSVVGDVNSLYVSTDATFGLLMLSKPNEEGSGILVTNYHYTAEVPAVSIMVENPDNSTQSDEVVRVTHSAIVPANDSVVDLGAAGSAWKSLTLNGNLNLGSGQYQTNTYTNSSDFDNGLVAITNSGGYALSFTNGWQDTAPGQMVVDLRGIQEGTLISFNGGTVTAIASMFVMGQEKINLQQVTGSLASITGPSQLTSIAIRKIIVSPHGNIVFPDGTVQSSAYTGPPESAPKIEFVNAPSSDSDTGTLGQMAVDSQYLYVCVGANQWKRSQLMNW